MNLPDLINGLFEVGGGGALLLSIRRLHRDKRTAGVHWAHVAFFFSWGLWNLYYYPSLGQWTSFAGGVLIVVLNAVWLGQMLYYGRAESGEEQAATRLLAILSPLSAFSSPLFFPPSLFDSGSGVAAYFAKRGGGDCAPSAPFFSNGVNPMPLNLPNVSYLQFLTWALKNVEILPEVGEIAGEYDVDAKLLQNWETTKDLGDLIVPRIDSFFELTASQEAPEHLEADILAKLAELDPPAEGEVNAAAWDGSRLLKLFETLAPLLITLLAK